MNRPIIACLLGVSFLLSSCGPQRFLKGVTVYISGEIVAEEQNDDPMAIPMPSDPVRFSTFIKEEFPKATSKVELTGKTIENPALIKPEGTNFHVIVPMVMFRYMPKPPDLENQVDMEGQQPPGQGQGDAVPPPPPHMEPHNPEMEGPTDVLAPFITVIYATITGYDKQGKPVEYPVELDHMFELAEQRKLKEKSEETLDFKKIALKRSLDQLAKKIEETVIKHRKKY